MEEPPSEGPDDWYFDERSQRWLRHSGRARWRQIFEEHRLRAATPEWQAARQALRDRLGIPAPPWTEQDETRFQTKMAEADADLFARIERRTSGRVSEQPCAVAGVRGYSGHMRRPDIELTDEAATFVERHPDIIARLAGQSPEAASSVEADDPRRLRFRTYIRERLSAAKSGELDGVGQAWLARYTGR